MNRQIERIDPRDFITGPFIKCPQCGEDEFGVLNICDDRYMRRCRNRNCWHTVTIDLPELKKKVVYIDQCAISNIMMVLSPEVKGHERAAEDPFWGELHEILDVVRRLQLVICPDSSEHEHESLAAPFFQSLKHTYEHLSGGLTYECTQAIKLKQIAEGARCFIRREEPKFNFDPQEVVRGRVHGWQDRFRISVDGVLPGTLEKLREARSKSHIGLQEVFGQWQKKSRLLQKYWSGRRGPIAVASCSVTGQTSRR